MSLFEEVLLMKLGHYLDILSEKQISVCSAPEIFVINLFIADCFICFKIFILFLFTWEREREREGQRERSHWCFTPKMPTGWKRPKSGSQSGSPTWVTGTQLLEPSIMSPMVCVSRRLEFGVEQDLNPGTLIWNVGITSRILLCQLLAPVGSFKWNRSLLCFGEGWQDSDSEIVMEIERNGLV